MKDQTALLVALTGVVLAIAPTPANAQVTFKGFGITDFVVSDMSANGSVAVGKGATGPGALRWTAAGGIEDIDCAGARRTCRSGQQGGTRQPI